MACTASVVLTVLGILLHLENRSVGGSARFFDPVMPAVAVAFPATGAFIASRRPDVAVGWLLCGGAALSVAFFAEQYAVNTMQVRPRDLPGGAWMAWLGDWLWVPGYLVVWTALPLLFPDGHAPGRRWIPLLWLVVAVGVVATALAALVPNNASSPALTGSVEAEGWRAVGGALHAIGVFLLAPLCWLGLLSRYRRAGTEARRQLKWPLLAGGLAVSVPVGAAVAGVLLGASPPISAYQIAGALSLLGVPAAIAVAIVRHRLYRLDVRSDTLVSRLLVHGILTAAGTGAYVLLVGLLEALVAGEHRFGLGLVALGVVGLALVGVRAPLQGLVDRFVYRRRRYDYEVLGALGQSLRSTIGPNLLLPTVVEAVAAGLKLPYVAIAAGHGGALVASAAHGEEPADVVVLPLVHQNEVVGRLTVAPRSPTEPFDAIDRRLLDEVAGQVAVVAYALCLTADLQRSRERLVTAREEERRRLRRDLHDGLQPAVAGVLLGLDAVRNMLGPDGAADDLLARLRTELETTAADVRRLVYDLRPPALDELGLLGALRQQAARFAISPTGPDIVVAGQEEISALPAAVEVAAYRICQEAVENVRKHAQAQTCEITLALLDDELRLEVRDDGRGVPREAGAGVGLTAMQERAAELGGSCQVESVPGAGTCVRALLPLGER